MTCVFRGAFYCYNLLLNYSSSERSALMLNYSAFYICSLYFEIKNLNYDAVYWLVLYSTCHCPGMRSGLGATLYL